MVAHLHDIRQGRRSLPFIEKHAGWILAVCVHVTLFAWLFTFEQPSWIDPPSKRPVIVMHLEPLIAPEIEYDPDATGEQEPIAENAEVAGDPASIIEPVLAVESAMEMAAAPPDIVVTPVPAFPEAGERREELPPEETQVAMAVIPAVPMESAEVAVDLPEPPVTPVEEPVDTTVLEELFNEFPELFEELERHERELAAQNVGPTFKGSEELARRMRLAEVQQVTQKTLHSQPVLQQGVHRYFDLSDIDLNTAQEDVLDRYGIRLLFVDINRVGQGVGGGGFINSAVTQSGRFVQPAGVSGGIHQGMIFGQIAEREMARLEEEALIARGYDPARTRLRRVAFGVIRTPAGYDLGVKSIEVEPVSPADNR